MILTQCPVLNDKPTHGKSGKGPFTFSGVNVNALYLINWDCTPFFERLAWFIKKSKEFNQTDIASDITALMLALSVN